MRDHIVPVRISHELWKKLRAISKKRYGVSNSSILIREAVLEKYRPEWGKEDKT